MESFDKIVGQVRGILTEAIKDDDLPFNYLKVAIKQCTRALESLKQAKRSKSAEDIKDAVEFVNAAISSLESVKSIAAKKTQD